MSQSKRGKTRHHHRYRCRECKRTKRNSGRFTLVTKVSEPQCPLCKSFDIYDAEKERRTEQINHPRCRCNNYPFPHAIGSLRFCVYHDLFNQEATKEELEEYKHCINTPRSQF